MFDKYDMPALMSDKGERFFHLMAKPASSNCNLDCAYCFYLSKGVLANGPKAGAMSDDVLEKFIEQYIASVTGNEVVFTWQGGEPTLRGIDFFQKVIRLQSKYKKANQRIENDLQSNGTLLNREWCSFLKEHSFLVGLSIDGPKKYHDQYRLAKGGQPTFEKVLGAVHLLHEFGIRFNTLTCVNRHNAQKPKEIYRFLRDDVGSTAMQFIPIVEYKSFQSSALKVLTADDFAIDGSEAALPGGAGSIVTDWSVNPYDWGNFLCGAFDLWYQRDVGKIFVNQFENLAAQKLGLPSQMCVYHEFCGKALAIEHDGSVYSCDHFVYPEYQLGNVMSRNLTRMVLSRTQVKFGYDKTDTLPSDCKECDYLNNCWGECPKNRIILTKSGEVGLNYLCRGLKHFFKHAIPKIEKKLVNNMENPIL